MRERQLDLESYLRFLKDTLPDQVLVDVRKPSMDGYQVAAILKDDPATQEIPVILISSIDRLLHHAKSLVSGAVDYVTDPFDAQEVLWRIETHISLRRFRETLESAACNYGGQPVAPNEDLERGVSGDTLLTQVTGRKHGKRKCVKPQES
jgi:PleD family two-component response regulator